MRISVIIPVYNEANYLPQLLNSILLQTRLPDEIIVCDNNSTDNTVTIARANQSQLPITIITQPIKGIIPTVEAAWRNASGDLILKTDADASLPKDWIRNIITHFHQDPELMACSGPWLASDGNLLDRILCSLGAYGGSYLLTRLRGYPLLLGPNTAFKRSALILVNGYANFPGLDDQVITEKLHLHGAKLDWFANNLVYHSSRRYRRQPQQYILSLLSFFHPRFYVEKA